MEGIKKEENTIAVYLTYQEAERFKIFQQFYDEFQLMASAGVFALKNGRAIIHKDSDSRCRKIEIENVAYIKK